MFRKTLKLENFFIFFFTFCITGGPQCTYIYSSFRNRNFWLEYSTPPTTQFPEYDDYGPESSSAVPDPVPLFIDAELNKSTVQYPVGSTVFLDCRVHGLIDFQVSWFRRQNSSLSVLTIGKDTFSADKRYTLDFEVPDNWRLKIQPAMAVDNGTYLCQISTHPPTILVTNLKIIVPRAFLVDEERKEISEKHYKPGSTIELHCVVTNYLSEFRHITWKHDNKIIHQNSPRGGISVKTSVGNGTVSSLLYLATANSNDSGTYTCDLNSGMAEARLILHILNGEEPAAIQSSRGYRRLAESTLGWILAAATSLVAVASCSTTSAKFLL